MSPSVCGVNIPTVEDEVGVNMYSRNNTHRVNVALKGEETHTHTHARCPGMEWAGKGEGSGGRYVGMLSPALSLEGGGVRYHCRPQVRGDLC